MGLDEVSANDGFVPISVNAPALGQLLAEFGSSRSFRSKEDEMNLQTNGQGNDASPN